MLVVASKVLNTDLCRPKPANFIVPMWDRHRHTKISPWRRGRSAVESRSRTAVESRIRGWFAIVIPPQSDRGARDRDSAAIGFGHPRWQFRSNQIAASVIAICGMWSRFAVSTIAICNIRNRDSAVIRLRCVRLQFHRDRGDYNYIN